MSPDCVKHSFPVGGKPDVRADLKALNLFALNWAY